MRMTRTERGADAAFSTLLAYRTYAGTETEDAETNMTRLMTDLMRLCSLYYGFTVEDVIQEARRAYEEDV